MGNTHPWVLYQTELNASRVMHGATAAVVHGVINTAVLFAAASPAK